MRLKVLMKWAGVGLLSLLLICATALVYMTWMPSKQFAGISENMHSELQQLNDRLQEHVRKLSVYTNGRNRNRTDSLGLSAEYISQQFRDAGLEVKKHSYTIDGEVYDNLVVDIEAQTSSKQTLLVGAHYDSVEGSPGADDNASGVAALIELARYLAGKKFTYNIRLVAFANEEPPFFQGDEMGSLVYARSLQSSDEKIIAMLSLESLGFYSDQPGSQLYPPLVDLLYPDKGNFVAFVGNIESRPLLTRAISVFRASSDMASEGIAAPAFIPGVSWSDHWSFWITGQQAIMITDTAPFRNPHYHQATDAYETLDYEKFARTTHGIFRVVETLANEGI